MVYASFPQGHGEHEDTTRSVVTPELAKVLADARHRLGWSLREAGRRVGVAFGTISHLEYGRRAPSAVVAESIISAYSLSPAEAAMLRAEAVEGAGWDSPFKQPSMGTAHSGAFYGARRLRGPRGARG